MIVVMTDDQRLWDMEAMPLTKRLLGEAGTTFENAVATYPLCCPSRATFLSGQYEHNHGVLGNHAPEGGYAKFDFSNALAVWLQAAGYRTAHVGKQLNEYGSALQPDQVQVAPGYDDWFATARSHDLLDVQLRRPGQRDEAAVRRVAGPTTRPTCWSSGRVARIREWAPDDTPFFIHLAPSAIHWELSTPRPVRAPHRGTRERSRTTSGIPARTSTSGMSPTSRASPPLRADRLRVRADDRERPPDAPRRAAGGGRGRRRGSFASSSRLGELEKTVILFTSDNGYLHGEHRMPSEKVVPYEESIRVPLLVRGPGFPAGARRRQLDRQHRRRAHDRGARGRHAGPADGRRVPAPVRPGARASPAALARARIRLPPRSRRRSSRSSRVPPRRSTSSTTRFGPTATSTCTGSAT